MKFSKPVPFWEAIKRLATQELMPTDLDTEGLSALDASIRRHSLFSARVTNAGFLQRAQDMVTALVDPRYAGGAPGTYVDRARAREALKNYLESIGYVPEKGKQGTLQDLSSDARLNLILDTNTRMAQGYGQFLQSNAPSAVAAFPALELYRLRMSQVPRDWPRKWQVAGGHFYGGRMIALRDDPIWMKSLDEGGFNRFGNPYPPFDFNSGMWTRLIGRSEAIQLGLIGPDHVARPSPGAYAAQDEADVRNLSDNLAAALVQSLETAKIVGGILKYLGAK